MNRLAEPVDGVAQVIGEVVVEKQLVDWLLQRLAGFERVPAHGQGEPGDHLRLVPFPCQIIQQQHPEDKSGRVNKCLFSELRRETAEENQKQMITVKDKQA